MFSKLQVPPIVSGLLDHPIARKQPLATLGRIFRWQVSSRLFGGYAVPFVGPTMLFVDRGMAGATGNIYYGLHEFEDMAFLLHMLRPGDLFIDVGSNVGVYSVLAAGVCSARTVAIEPIPTTLEALKRNLALNDLSTLVTVVEAAAGDSEEPVWMTTHRDAMNRIDTQSDSDANRMRVAVVRLDDCVDSAPTLMKIDVEGYENQVLRGAESLLFKSPPKAMIIERAGLNDQGLALLERTGFVEYSYDPWQRVVSPGNSARNVLFVRDLDFVESRVRESRGFSLPRIGLRL
ncbi:MAG: FkbM family methyltransferase [Myxococcota bacterium]